MSYLVLNVGLFIVLSIESAYCSSCSQQARASDPATCLSDINATLHDGDRFWFGTDYFVRCPLGIANGIQCSNHKPQQAQSFWDRLFSTSSTKPEFDRYLSMQFESIGKNYSGCGVTYRATGSDVWRKDIDPLSSDIVEPWFVRNRPQLSWPYSADEYFTLIVYDGGYPVNHGIYTNIQGNDLDSSEAIKPYHGPKASSDLENPYIFLLYKHNTRLNITQAQLDAFLGSEGSWGSTGNELATFVDSLGVGGPVAVNLFVARGDIYGATYMEQAGVLFMCPVFATRALSQHSRPFIPQSVALTVWLDVHFTTSPVNFTVCCNRHTVPGGVTRLNPIGDPVVNTAMLRTDATVSYSVMKQGLYMGRNNFAGEYHTLLIVDPDVSNPTVGSEARPLLHGMIINVVEGNFSTGEVVRTYMGPSPPDSSPHTYYFLLYKQAGTVNAADMTSHIDITCRSDNGRCLYDINQAISDQNLQLVGANWLRAERDAYAMKVAIGREPSQEQRMCRGTNGYEDPCPTSGATRVQTKAVFESCRLVFFSLTLIFCVNV